MSERFFELASGRAAPFSALPEPELSDEAEQALASGRTTPSKPLVLRRNSDRAIPDDFGFGGSPALLLVSARFVGALRESGCTGWATFPIDLVDEDGSPISSDHAGLAITGRCGAIDPLAGEELPDRPAWRRGMVVSDGTWDGSDLFRPDGRDTRLVTDRARQALLDGGVRGLAFTPLEDVEVYVPRGLRGDDSRRAPRG